jgi:hypothetical protein
MYEHMQRENVANNLKNGELKNGEQFEFHYSRKTMHDQYYSFLISEKTYRKRVD